MGGGNGEKGTLVGAIKTAVVRPEKKETQKETPK